MKQFHKMEYLVRTVGDILNCKERYNKGKVVGGLSSLRKLKKRALPSTKLSTLEKVKLDLLI